VQSSSSGPLEEEAKSSSSEVGIDRVDAYDSDDVDGDDSREVSKEVIDEERSQAVEEAASAVDSQDEDNENPSVPSNM
jgi:hypothetical protein